MPPPHPAPVTLSPRPHARDGGRLVLRLWGRLTDRAPDEASLHALDTALSLLTDHDLAAATLAVRVVTSARAHVHAVVSAGLGVLEGPLHGAAGGLAHRSLPDPLDEGSAVPVIAAEHRADRRITGRGPMRACPVFTSRAHALFALPEHAPRAEPARLAAHDIVAITVRHTRRTPMWTRCGCAPTATTWARGSRGSGRFRAWAGTVGRKSPRAKSG
ncbi:hypothetical protein CTZ28_27560 [Streptomyces shenzhenensis]|uniref:Uncharacterized protein n=1 Tax=Streptomyces shenzhenensis TaxID=943815 RepID=A0A3M0I216_9ACTN|nr:hypothetical protein CTZ28_27560 [Streptomyces shenzhenensis]